MKKNFIKVSLIAIAALIGNQAHVMFAAKKDLTVQITNKSDFAVTTYYGVTNQLKKGHLGAIETTGPWNALYTWPKETSEGFPIVAGSELNVITSKGGFNVVYNPASLNVELRTYNVKTSPFGKLLAEIQQPSRVIIEVQSNGTVKVLDRSGK